jgi:membrane-associated phospholipid phosphatase
MRTAENVALAYFLYASVASLLFHVGARERAAVIGLNLLIAMTLTLLSRRASAGSADVMATVRDWLPCALVPLAYREAALLFTPDPRHRLDYIFENGDRLLLAHPWVEHALKLGTPWVEQYLEFSYLLCYPLVPLGLGTLYWARKRGQLPRAGTADLESMIDRYWTTILLAVLTSYVLYPFFPLTPPRVLFHDLPYRGKYFALRRLNEGLLRFNGDRPSLFPSGHVAGVTATALAVRSLLPRAGLGFLIAAASIAIATVVGRYHYAVDALAGALVAVVAHLISRKLARLW